MKYRLQTQIITKLLIIILISAVSLKARDQNQYIFGSGSEQCVESTYESVPVTKSNLYVNAHKYNFNGETIDHITLTTADHSNCVGVSWLKNHFYDWQNGFEVEFNMELSGETCVSNLNWFGKTKCGGDGFAFVLQPSGARIKGTSGSGLGYKGINNVFAIEFDTFYNAESNDPSTPVQRHISVITRNGQASADESNSIAWNDNPINFKSSQFEGYKHNSQFKIRYMDDKLSVYVNDALQLQYRDFLNIGLQLGLKPDQQFFMGVTASTGTVTQNQILRNWNVKMVKNDPTSTQLDYQSQVMPDVQNIINVTLKTKCGRKYVPVSGKDSLSYIKYVISNTSQDCRFIESMDGPERQRQQSGASYILKFSCGVVGNKEIIIYYKDAEVGRAKFLIGPGPLKTAEVDFDKYGPNTGSTDTDYVFGVIAYDSALNKIDRPADAEELRQKLSIQWPNPAESQNTQTVVYDAANFMYKVTVKASKVGKYTIKGSVFQSEKQFTINLGAPSPSRSYAKATQVGGNSLLPQQVVAGAQKAKLTVYLYDQYDNAVPSAGFLNKLLAELQYSVHEQVQPKRVLQVTNDGSTNLNFAYADNISLTYRDSMFLSMKLNGVQLQCQGCQVFVLPSTLDFSKTEVKLYDNTYKKYNEVDQNNIKSDVLSPLAIALQFFDVYSNRLQNVDTNNLVSKFSGNDMDEITLCRENSGNGPILTVCQQNQAYYHNLVGRSNYELKSTMGSNSKTWKIQLLSDGSDADAGNGKLDLSQTLFQWLGKGVETTALVGSSNYVRIEFRTQQGLRFNQPGYPLPSDISLTFTDLEVTKNEKVYEFVQLRKTGTFSANVNLYKSGTRTSTLKVLGTTISTVLTLNLTPQEVSKIVLSSIPTLPKTLENQQILFNLFDKYDNPTTEKVWTKLATTFKATNVFNYLNGVKQAFQQEMSVIPQQIEGNKYSLNFMGQNSGDYTFSNQYFAKIETLTLKSKGPQSTSSASILNDLNTFMLGQNINFELRPLNEDGALFSKDDLIKLNYYHEFGLSYTLGDTTVQVPITESNVNADGTILIKILASKKGTINFMPRLLGQNMNCAICQIIIAPGPVFPLNTVLNRIIEGKEEPIDPNSKSKLLLENKKRIPIFTLNFYDAMNNYKSTLESGWSFTGKMSVPLGSIKEYNFLVSLEGNQKIRFEIATQVEKDIYFQDLANDATLSFQGQHNDGRTIKFDIKNAALVGSPDDLYYTNEIPSVNTVDVLPKTVTGTVANWYFVEFQLKSANGLLYAHTNTGGWYEGDLTKSIQIDNSKFQEVKILKGKKKGSYLIYFQTLVAQESEIWIKFKNIINNTEMLTAQVKFTITMGHGPISHLRLKADNHIADCKSPETRLIQFQPLDLYNNQVKSLNIGEIGLSWYGKAVYEIFNYIPFVNKLFSKIKYDPTIDFDGAYVNMRIQCVKADLLTITTSKQFTLAANSAKFTLITMNIVTGTPFAEESLVEVDKTEMSAGQTVRLSVLPRDGFKNPITINIADADHAISKWSAKYTLKEIEYPLGALQVSQDKKSYYIDVLITKAGTANFQVLYDGQLCKNVVYRTQVNRLDASFDHTILQEFDDTSKQFINYDNNAFTQLKSEYPQFKVVLNDKYGNNVDIWPSWALSIFLTGTEIDYNRRIQFEPQLDKFTFELPALGLPSDQLILIPTMDRYINLINNREYKITMKLSDVQKKDYKLNLKGEKMDDDASNLPIEVQNTVISPTDTLGLRAGESVEINMELRTTNANLRANTWFTNPSEKIILKFSQVAAPYTISNGIKKGRYIIRISPIKSTDELVGNIITININGQDYGVLKPKMIVRPNSINKVILTNSIGVDLSSIGTVNVDDNFVQYFRARDVYDNDILLNNEKTLNAKMINGSKEQEFESSISDKGLFVFTTQVKIPGNYLIQFKPSPQEYAFTLIQGQISTSITMANVIVPPTTFQAGERATVEVVPKDQWGNILKVDENMLKSYQVKYSYRLKTDTTYLEGDNDFTLGQDGKLFTTQQLLTDAGEIKFKVTLKTEALKMSQSYITVVPNSKLNLQQSKYNYYNVDTQKYDSMVTSSYEYCGAFLQDCQCKGTVAYGSYQTWEYSYADGNQKCGDGNIFKLLIGGFKYCRCLKHQNMVQEDNINYESKYSIVASDDYGNLHTTFPQQDQFNMKLTGDVFTQENPVKYVVDDVIGPNMLFSIKDSDLSRYKSALFRAQPYVMSVEYQTQKQNFEIVLLGQGSQDKDAEIEGKLSTSLSTMDKSSVTFIAGESTSVNLFVKTANGKRMADASDKLTFGFTQADGLSTESFKAQFYRSDLNGNFIITVTGTKANNKVKPCEMTVFINGVQLEGKLNMIVHPNSLDHISMNTDLSVSGSADDDFLFDITPQDKYKNVAVVSSNDVNLGFEWVDSSQPGEWNTKKDPSTGFITYHLNARIVGVYKIKSPLFKEDIHKFTIVAGAANKEKSTVYTKPNLLYAGEEAITQIRPIDAWNNLLPVDRVDAAKSFIVSVVFDNVDRKIIEIVPNIKTGYLEAKWTHNKVGSAQVFVEVQSGYASCNSCNLRYFPAPLDLSKTQFLVEVSKNTFVEMNRLSIEYGSKSLSIVCKFFDPFNNPITDLNDNDIFSASTVAKHNAQTFNLNLEKSTNQAVLSLKSEDADLFSRLVINKDYEISLQFKDMERSGATFTKTLPFDITGEASVTAGAGNGPMVIGNTHVSNKDIILIAGEKQTFDISVMNSEKLRYNGIMSVDDVKIEETKSSQGPEKVVFEVSTGAFNGLYQISMYAEKALTEGQAKQATLTILGQSYNTVIHINVMPASPDYSKTFVSKKLPASVMTDSSHQIKFQIFDKFMNKFSKSEFSKYLIAKPTVGYATFHSTTLDSDGDYSISVTPVYPPKEFGFQIYYQPSESKSVAILSEPLKSIITTQFDWTKTEILGADMIDIPVDQKIQFQILLKDNKGYCFEQDKTVTARAIGPYLTNDKKNATLAIENLTPNIIELSVQKTSGGDVVSSDYSCNNYYSVSIPAGTLKMSGYYLLDIYIDGSNNNNAVISQRSIKMIAGATYPKLTQLSMPKFRNKGNAPVINEVNTEFVVQAQMRDQYGNLCYDNRESDELDFSIPSVPSQLLEKSVTYMKNCQFEIKLSIKKVGIMKFMKDVPNGIVIKINKQQFITNDLDIIDFPKQITLVPGACSSVYPTTTFQTNYPQNNIDVGIRTQFDISCKDKYNNAITQGGDLFSVTVKGLNLTDIGFDTISGNIQDYETGSYGVQFTTTWPGEYQLNIEINNSPYIQYDIYALPSVCPKDRPFYCSNTKTCVGESYLKCNLPDYDTNVCSDKNKPLSCKVNGIQSCVSGHWQCDCPTGFSKCTSDNKCVPTEKVASLCSTIMVAECNIDMPYKCVDGSCRLTSKECPSQPGCPPGFKLCADQTCASSYNACNFENFSACPNNRMFKCEDQTCVDSPDSCPTRITCSDVNMIICPDKTCATSELQCRQPPKCVDGQTLCPDQTCMANKENCPATQVCPNGYARCDENSCQLNCQNTGNTQAAALEVIVKQTQARILQVVTASNYYSGNCGAGLISCPGGECALSFFMCPTVETCPVGTIKCPDLSCAASKQDCVVKTCQPGQFHCWDGKCVSDKKNCATRTTCPESKSVKCPSGNCVTNVSECDIIVTCTGDKPYKCANGECRSKEDDCPTFITCPSNRPIKCSDGSCQRSRGYCTKIVEAIKCPNGKILCPNGSCAQSVSLCPTTQSCGKNQIRCWDNSCADSLTDCPILSLDQDITPSNYPLRCPDGSFRANLLDCPSNFICPSERPIKCEDGTCQQSNSQCSSSGVCSFGQQRCPDGSCSVSTCGTPITCSSDAPYYCYDNTCKKDPRDCPKVPQCSPEAPILCPDGTCSSQRVNCRGFDKCPIHLPVRCPNMQCYASQSECVSQTGCPLGKVLCDDSSCATSYKNCPVIKCPLHLPIQCKDGFCVSDSKYCNNPKGCPYDSPFKCPNGMCTDKLEKCPESICPEKLPILCPDGSCNEDFQKCPNQMGCPIEKPLRCGSGECINSNSTSCGVAICPKETPVKCLDGLCVETHSGCSSTLDSSYNDQCSKNTATGNIVPCADGRCVSSSDQCRPVFACPLGQTRCKDGSCRPLESLCPLNTKACPDNKPFMCNIGSCAKSVDECPMYNGCTIENPVKCDKAGTCAKTNDDCAKIYGQTKLPNGCTFENPFRCDDNKCVKDLKLCTTSGCKDSSKPIKCLDGSCVSTQQECKLISLTCKAGEYLCPDNICVTEWNKCNLKNGCPVLKPFKCADGECSSSPFNGFGETGCKPTIQCPKHTPYLCSDGECVGDQSHCNVQKPCPSSTPFRCADFSCSASLAECSTLDMCPLTSPVLCSSGLCVKKVYQCNVASAMYCPTEMPFKCVTGECKKFPHQCNQEKQTFQQLSNNKLVRILQASPTTQVIDQGCNSATPHKCYDGSCRLLASNCPALPGCSNPSKPFRCISGVCVQDKADCQVIDKDLPACDAGLSRCVDGVCRIDCPAHYGCPKDKPLQCANGFCGVTLGDCAGESGCPILTPFRCIDNTCVENMDTCTQPIRSNIPELVTVSIGNLQTNLIDFIQSANSQEKHGQLLIPAGSLLYPLELQDSKDKSDKSSLQIIPVQESIMHDSTTTTDQLRYHYVKQFYPHSEGQLEFHQTVRSPVVQIQVINRDSTIDYRFPMQLQLNADYLYGTDKQEDYCLGKFEEDTKKWNCASRILTSANVNDQLFQYPIQNDGIYAVLFNPDEPKANANPQPCLFFCQYKEEILWTLLGFAIFSVVFGYIFWRVSRYVNKYKHAKQQMENYKEQISEMEQAQTDVVGQSLKDKLQGINFTVNPVANEQKQESSQDVERIAQLEAIIDKLTKRDKMIGQVNQELSVRNRVLSDEIDKLKDRIGQQGKFVATHEMIDFGSSKEFD